jgi:hypothetical protein
MAIEIAPEKLARSRQMRVGLLGAIGAIGGELSKSVVGPGLMSSTLGGALAALLVSQTQAIRLSRTASVALLGAVSGYTGRLLSNELAAGAPGSGVPFRALLGLVLGGSVGAISADGLSPPEIKVLAKP